MTEQTPPSIVVAEVATQGRPNRLGLKALGAAMTIGALLVPTACSTESAPTHTTTYDFDLWADDMSTVGKLTPEVPESAAILNWENKLEDKNPDPNFRANSVVVMTGQDYMMSPQGRGAIIEQDGVFSFITTEHVTEELLFDRNPLDEEGKVPSGQPQKSDKYDADKIMRLFIPGAGSFRVDSDNSVAYQDSRYLDPNGGFDGFTERFATVTLDEAQQKFIQEAKDKGLIETSELAAEQPSLGDIIYMPVPESGKNIPLIYLNTQSGKMSAYPAIIFDEGGNEQKAAQTFMAMREEIKSQLLQEGRDSSTIYDSELNHGAQEIALQKFLEKHSKTADSNIKFNLPCMGDSGSPILNKKGEILGMLGLGWPGSEFGTYISRDTEMTDNANAMCLFDVQISVPGA